jgi:uncharacterized membrane protein YfcA
LIANLTNTVALTPGYLGASWSQRGELAGQGQRIRLLVPAACLGGLAGGGLLLRSDAQMFAALVPWLILFGTALLALQTPLRRLLRPSSVTRRGINPSGAPPLPLQRRRRPPAALIGAITLAAMYGGYFGAGLSVIFLACLGLAYDDSLTKLNGLKQLLSLATNACAALVLMASGRVDWGMALIVALASILGGALGGAVAGRVNGEVLRWLVVVLGLAMGLWFFWS